MLVRSIAVLLLCVGLQWSGVSAAEWQEKQNERGILIQQQPTASGYAITRGTREIATTLPVLVNVLRDAGVCRQLIYSCKFGKVVETYTKNERLDYMVIDAPLLLDDRDIYIHSTSSYDQASKTVMIRLSGREKYDAGQPGKVRVRDMNGFWRFQQVAPDKVSVTYQVYSDPQIPGGTFFSGVLAESVFFTLENLTKLVREAKYQTGEPIEALM